MPPTILAENPLKIQGKIMHILFTLKEVQRKAPVYPIITCLPLFSVFLTHQPFSQDTVLPPT